MAKTSKKKITDYHFDNRNINLGSEFGDALLEKSLREAGAGRSVLSDKNGIIIAGNKTLQKASEIGITNIVEVETDGTELVVVKRKDLSIDSAAGTRLKILDNTVSKHNYVEDAEVVEAICEEYQIDNPVGLGLGEPVPSPREPVTFSASKKPVIKIEFTDVTQLLGAEADIAKLIESKYRGAMVTIKGKP